ncbi:hypothetical protein [Duganella sp. S19_KUP01_CR8]|uniref:hypothetical protein n=1 Tax=Duganella sp. S19_KUP01_CR8 TaxID=3025502 RepID=UPI002FCDCF4B
MNARCQPSVAAPDTVPPVDEIWRFVKQLLASPTFAKAPRMCQLLTFLLQRKLSGCAHEINEYAIGLGVYGRDSGQYDTALDPSVRVQVGRLRNRLKAYYADSSVSAGVLITIPLGGYVPVVRANLQPQALARGAGGLHLAPLRNLAAAGTADAFVFGLDEELGSRLYRHGASLQLDGAGAAMPLRLEGSVRVEENRVRASMRLVDTGANRVEWLSQFDRCGHLGISLQEELAAAICSEVQTYLGWSPIGGMLTS